MFDNYLVVWIVLACFGINILVMKRIPYSYSTFPNVYLKARKKCEREGTSISMKIHEYLVDFVSGEPEISGVSDEGNPQDLTKRISEECGVEPDVISAMPDSTADSEDSRTGVGEVGHREESRLAGKPLESSSHSGMRRTTVAKKEQKKKTVTKGRQLNGAKTTSRTVNSTTGRNGERSNQVKKAAVAKVAAKREKSTKAQKAKVSKKRSH